MLGRAERINRDRNGHFETKIQEKIRTPSVTEILMVRIKKIDATKSICRYFNLAGL